MMARITWPVPIVAVVLALAGVAWWASPQTGVLDRAADALEAVGVVHLRTSTGEMTVDYGRDVAVIERPMDGVAQRLVIGDDVYDLLDDGTWLHPDGVPELFAQDPAAQLRAIDGHVEPFGEGRYRIGGGRDHALLDLADDGVPRTFTSIVGGEALWWEVVGRGGRVAIARPAQARDVTAAEHLELVSRAASPSG